MEKRVLTVLRSGGEYGPEHVQAIKRQVEKWGLEGTRVVCLTDTDVPGVECIPLREDWPGWWSKLELFAADLGDDFLYTDLDNVIFGPIGFAQETARFTADIGFSFFKMAPGVPRSMVIDYFRADPEFHMNEWSTARKDSKFGDAAFLRHRCKLEPARWDMKLVANVVDLKPVCPWRVAPPSIPADLRVLLCGGRLRRPWLSHSVKVREAYWLS